MLCIKAKDIFGANKTEIEAELAETMFKDVLCVFITNKI
jgi:hypothetical protein